jgi:hypothetical protein
MKADQKSDEFISYLLDLRLTIFSEFFFSASRRLCGSNSFGCGRKPR